MDDDLAAARGCMVAVMWSIIVFALIIGAVLSSGG